MTSVVLQLCDQGLPVFDDDDPVLCSHPLHEGRAVPRFGDRMLWDLSAVRTAVNIPPNQLRCRLDLLDDPGWNLRTRELLMIRLNPQHPKVRARGVFLGDRPSRPRIAASTVYCLRVLSEWAQLAGLGVDVSGWPGDIGERMLRHLAEQRAISAASQLQYAEALRDLYRFGSLMADGGLDEDPFERRALTSSLIGSFRQRFSECTTEVLTPGRYWPIVRAAWRYVDVFADDIIAANEQRLRYQQWKSFAERVADPERRLECWAGDRESFVPVHLKGRAQTAGTPNLSLIEFHAGVARFQTAATAERRDQLAAMTAAMLDAGRGRPGGLIPGVADVDRADGSRGQWCDGLDAQATEVQVGHLRAACFIFIAAFVGMRDSEIQELERGAVSEWCGSPVIESRLRKQADGEMRRWAIIDPVAKAVAALEQITTHDRYLFSPVRPMTSGRKAGIASWTEINEFAGWIHSRGEQMGLEPIALGPLSSQRFRRTFAVQAAREPFAEIALGWQLQHVANRLTTTQAYMGDPTNTWADALEDEQLTATTERLYDAFLGYQSGEPAAGPGVGRRNKLFAEVGQDLVTRFNGEVTDEGVVRQLLRHHATRFYPGTVNDCLFNAATAECLRRAARGPTDRPLLSVCEPGTCANSTVREVHVPLWRSNGDRIDHLLARSDISPVQRELLESERRRVDSVVSNFTTEAP